MRARLILLVVTIAVIAAALGADEQSILWGT